MPAPSQNGHAPAPGPRPGVQPILSSALLSMTITDSAKVTMPMASSAKRTLIVGSVGENVGGRLPVRDRPTVSPMQGGRRPPPQSPEKGSLAGQSVGADPLDQPLVAGKLGGVELGEVVAGNPLLAEEALV